MKPQSLLSSLAFALLLGAASLHAQVPQLLNYQGRVISNGTNFTGNGQFKFALVNAAGAVTYWSNDGTSVAGSQPAAAVTLAVASGLYSVLLGDTSLAGMTAIPATVFNNGDVRLRVWFNDGVTGSQLLTPDQRIAAVGYAMMGANVPDGSITTAKLADGAITAAKIADGTIVTADLAANSVNSGHIIDGQVANADLANNAVNSAKVQDATLTGADLAVNTVTSVQLADSIELGNSATSGQLDIFRNGTGTESIRLFGGSSQISTYGSDGLEQARLWGPSWGELILNNSLANNATAVTLTAQGSAGGRLTLNNTNGSSRAILEGENTGGLLTLLTADGNTGAVLYGNEGAGSGALSLRNTNGLARFRAYGGPSDGSLELYSNNGRLTFAAEGGEGTSGSQVNMWQSNGVRTLQFDAENGFEGGGFIGLYANDGGAAIVASAGTQGGALTVYEEDGTATTLIHNVSDAGVVSVRNSSGVETAYIWGRNNAGQTGGQIGLKNSSGVQTITIDADSAGDGKITTQVLQITGGSDLSENFEVNAGSDPLEAGMIVSIDPKNPGELVLSRTAHDKRVAGILSGAGGVKTGMLMGQAGTKADGKHPVALTGRVYCWVDADASGAVEPGDLITTSATPGHGMKAANHSLASGAIIGKAMTSLEKGRGLVLVLVSLQ